MNFWRKTIKTKDTYVEFLENTYYGVAAYHYIAKQASSKDRIFTKNNFSLIGNQKFDLNEKDFRDNYGRPGACITVNEKFDLKFYFHRIKIRNFRAKLTTHFQNGDLFMYSYCFPNLTPNETKEIIDLLGNKYLDGQDFETNKHSLLDSNNTILFIDKGIDLVLYYININSEFLKNTKFYFAKERSRKDVPKKRKSTTLQNRL